MADSLCALKGCACRAGVRHDRGRGGVLSPAMRYRFMAELLIQVFKGMKGC